MARSPKSRGKGNRRMPGRAGGARKRKPVGPWERCCQHTVADLAELPSPVASLVYVGEWGKTLGHRAYVFDQAMARVGVWYHAKLGVRYRRRALLISVSGSHTA